MAAGRQKVVNYVVDEITNLKAKISATFPKTLPELYKIEPLDGTNYKRWSQKLLVCFEQLEIDYVLTTDLPNDSKNNC